MSFRAQRGVTLVEMLVVITIAAILLAIAIPSFASFIQRNRADNAANALFRGASLARSEALTRGRVVTLCAGTTGACGTDFTTGYRVFIDVNRNGDIDAGEEVLQFVPGFANGLTVTNNLGIASVPFEPTGYPRRGGVLPSANGALLVDLNGVQRSVCVSPAGVVALKNGNGC